MARYDSVVTGIALKQQPLGETDILVTWYTKELGKLRSLIVGGRRIQSRLSFALVPGSVVKVRLVGRNEHVLLKLAGVVSQTVYIKELYEENGVLLSWLSEILLKATPDAEPNSDLFSVAVKLFQSLSVQKSGSVFAMNVALALMGILAALGVAIHEEIGQPKYFSIRAGGFFMETDQSDKVSVPRALWDRYVALRNFTLLETWPEGPLDALDATLVVWLQGFLEYHLERPIRSFSVVSGIIHRDINI